ncbi:MAG TPA: hypothetical protein VMT87_13220 [Vicinamibacteria bacterium]|nr:hypothetical protein [Vicinamibacteria bacterium]
MTVDTAAALAGAAAGTAALYAPLRAAAGRAASLGACALLLFGTGLGWAVFPAADPPATAAFLLSALAVRRLPRTARPSAAAGAALLLAAGLAVALGPDLVRLEAPRLGDALFSSRHGLFFWNPVLWLGVAGLAASCRRDRWRAGVLASALGAALVVLACRPAEASGPWSARRWTVALPLLAPGLAVALDALARVAARQPGRVLAPAGALLVAWNLLFMEQYRDGLLPRDGTVSFVTVAENNAALLSRRFGSPPAWPANWAFAWRHGLPLDRYDLLAGKRLARSPTGREIDVGDLSLDAALLLDGWSVRHPCGEAVCRAVEGRARLIAPLDEPEPFALTVHASGAGLLLATVNGVEVGVRGLTPGMTALRFPPGPRTARMNELSLAVAPGGRALVDRLSLERPGDAP